MTTTVRLRDAFLALNDLVFVRLAERGHPAIRPAHGAVFQHLDDDGTTVSALGERAQMTKQAMGELVLRLESLGYVERAVNPDDRREKLVRPTASGVEVIAIAQEFAAELEDRLRSALGARRYDELQDDLDRIEREVAASTPGAAAADAAASTLGAAAAGAAASDSGARG